MGFSSYKLASRSAKNVEFRIGKSEVILNDELSTDELNASRIILLKYEQSFLVAESKFDKLKVHWSYFATRKVSGDWEQGLIKWWRLVTVMNFQFYWEVNNHTLLC